MGGGKSGAAGIWCEGPVGVRVREKEEGLWIPRKVRLGELEGATSAYGLMMLNDCVVITSPCVRRYPKLPNNCILVLMYTSCTCTYSVSSVITQHVSSPVYSSSWRNHLVVRAPGSLGLTVVTSDDMLPMYVCRNALGDHPLKSSVALPPRGDCHVHIYT